MISGSAPAAISGIDSVTLGAGDSLATATVGGTSYAGGTIATTAEDNRTGLLSSFPFAAGTTAPAGSSVAGEPSVDAYDDNVLTGVAGGFAPQNGGVMALRWGIGLTDNDADPDFFIFEDGGNDTVEVQAILGDGTLGVAVPLSGWTTVSTSGVLRTSATNPLSGRTVSGLAFDFTDLLDAAGANLTNGTNILGIMIGDASAADFYEIYANVDVTSAPPTPPAIELVGTTAPLILPDPTTAGSLTATISNTGETSMSVSSLALSGTGFSITSPVGGFSVAGGATQDIEIAFDASSISPATAAATILTVNSDASNDTTFDIPLAAGLSSTSQLLANWDFEAAGTSLSDPFAVWQEFGVPTNVIAVPGLKPGSTTAAYLDNFGGSSTITNDAPIALNNFVAEMDFAIRDTTTRAFNVIFRVPAAAGSGLLNIRYEAGIWSARGDGVWQTLIDMTGSPLTPSVDPGFDGSFDEPGDSSVVYTLRLTMSGWGTASPSYDLEIFDSASSSLGSSTGNSVFQNGVLPTAGLGQVELTTAFGSNPGFWVDDVQVSGSVLTDFFLSNPVLAGGTVSVDITSAGNVDIYRSTTLLPGSWTLTDAGSNVTPGTAVVVDNSPPSPKAFYIAVPTGDPAP